MDTKPKRRWFHYSLRTLLVLVTIASAGFGWLGLKMRQAQRQQAAVEAIEELGGVVWYGPDSGAPQPYDPIWLQKLFGKNYFVNVYGIIFDHTLVTDDELGILESCAGLQHLSLSRTRITDLGLVHLQGLSHLNDLSLCKTAITDSGLLNLRRLNRLEILYLKETQITDAGLVHLRGMNQLKEVHLNSSKVTKKGRQQLQEALPGLIIYE